MSFVKTLATLAVGFAAAKGFEKFSQAGGMAGMQERLQTAGQPGGMADQVGQMAEKMGIPGGADMMRKMAAQFGSNAASATAAGQAGMTNMMGALAGMLGAGTDAASGMMAALPGGKPMVAMGEENAKLMIRAMIQAAKADGEIDAEERAAIMSHLKDASPEEMAFVEAEFAAPVDPAGLAAAAGDTVKAQVYAAAVMAIRVDTPAESAYLDQLASALGLDAAAREAVHRQLGA